MAIIRRDINGASRGVYDLVIIGGGIHGVMLALEASIRGLKALLVEQGDFGASTSYNSLRILHGGFRYLQHADLPRLYTSVNERRWFLKHFPNHVAPLGCLMPLYGQGPRRALVMRAALKVYDVLTRHRNDGLPEHQWVPDGRVLGPAETLAHCEVVPKTHLEGGALWYDGFMPDSQRILIGALRWAAEYGLTALNYVRATGLLKVSKDTVAGIAACDARTGTELQFSARVVVNAAGPWGRDVARAFDRDNPALFRSMLAWNVLFDRPAISAFGIAAAAPGPGAHTYFIVPWKERMLAGTGHAPWLSLRKKPAPTRAQLDAFCFDLNLALPGLHITSRDIVHVFCGLQSATTEGGTEFAKREIISDHSENGGPKGFYSISGIKFTTARKLAERTIEKLFPAVAAQRLAWHAQCPPPADALAATGVCAFDWFPDIADQRWAVPFVNIARQEAVVHLDDLVLRRSGLGDNPARAMAVGADLCRQLGWDGPRARAEIERLRNHFAWMPDPTSGAPEQRPPASRVEPCGGSRRATQGQHSETMASHFSTHKAFGDKNCW
jgi:glycerol-3-phosphate dehydrogenase